MNDITLTIDLEDGHDLYATDGRYIRMADKWLDLCDACERKATFFTIGKMASSAPDLIRRIATKGHEIAFHTMAHRSLTEEDPKRFLEETREAKKRLEDLAGKAVIGFRAPRYSLTPASLWALDCLQETGFLYSSSLMPTAVSLFGFPKAPRTPFKWKNGLIEFPLPVAKIGSKRIPYLGGIYLYAMPFALTKHLVSKAEKDEVLWTYGHPYDLDRDEPFEPLPGAPLWVSLVLWLARARAEKQIHRVLALAPGKPFAALVSDTAFLESLPSFLP